MADLDETMALAWLCEYLPRFRFAAGNRTRLEKIVTDVRDGRKTAVWAREQLGGEDPCATLRNGDADGQPLSLRDLNIDSITVTGEYVCPHDRCGRRSQPDDKGREPQCHLGTNPAPMRFRGRS